MGPDQLHLSTVCAGLAGEVHRRARYAEREPVWEERAAWVSPDSSESLRVQYPVESFVRILHSKTLKSGTPVSHIWVQHDKRHNYPAQKPHTVIPTTWLQSPGPCSPASSCQYSHIVRFPATTVPLKVPVMMWLPRPLTAKCSDQVVTNEITKGIMIIKSPA